MKHDAEPLSRERGVVHAWTLLVVILIGSSVQLAGSRALRLRAEARELRAELRARYAAEAGLEHARALVLGGCEPTLAPSKANADLAIVCDGIRVQVDFFRDADAKLFARARATLYPDGSNGLPHSSQLTRALP